MKIFILLLPFFATAWQVAIGSETISRLYSEQQWLIESMTLPEEKAETEYIEDEISTGQAAPVRENQHSNPMITNPWELDPEAKEYRPARKRSR